MAKAYYVKIDNLGLNPKPRENEKKSDDSQDTDTYKILSVRDGAYSEDRLAKLVNEHMRDSLLEDYSYITEVLGVDLPVNESGDALPLTEELRDKILKEQLTRHQMSLSVL